MFVLFIMLECHMLHYPCSISIIISSSTFANKRTTIATHIASHHSFNQVKRTGKILIQITYLLKIPICEHIQIENEVLSIFCKISGISGNHITKLFIKCAKFIYYTDIWYNGHINMCIPMRISNIGYYYIRNVSACRHVCRTYGFVWYWDEFVYRFVNQRSIGET